MPLSNWYTIFYMQRFKCSSFINIIFVLLPLRLQLLLSSSSPFLLNNCTTVPIDNDGKVTCVWLTTFTSYKALSVITIAIVSNVMTIQPFIICFSFCHSIALFFVPCQHIISFSPLFFNNDQHLYNQPMLLMTSYFSSSAAVEINFFLTFFLYFNQEIKKTTIERLWKYAER